MSARTLALFLIGCANATEPADASLAVAAPGSACASYDRARFEAAYANAPACKPQFGDTEPPECLAWSKSLGFDFTLSTDCVASDGGFVCAFHGPFPLLSKTAPTLCAVPRQPDPDCAAFFDRWLIGARTAGGCGGPLTNDGKFQCGVPTCSECPLIAKLPDGGLTMQFCMQGWIKGSMCAPLCTQP